MASVFESVIGLEVHVQLLTATKLFCRCPNRFGAPPNTLVCPLCMGYPGALPVLNRRAVDRALTLALALGFQVRETSRFARKSYFYPDLPKGYQITQYDRPLATSGSLPLSAGGRAIRLRRLHLEEDAGKLLHQAPGGLPLPGRSLVDFNRCGVPLVEIVSEPDLASPQEAQDFLQALRQVLLFTEVSDGNMEEGSLRCDANVSLRRRGEEGPGVRTEVKNLNSFRNTGRALRYEIERQARILEAGGAVEPQTLAFDEGRGETTPLRGKEEARDYRYFPEPDLPSLRVSSERLEAIRSGLPELPWALRERLATAYGLGPEEARLLAGSRQLAGYFEAAAAAFPGPPGTLAIWILTALRRELKERKQGPERAPAPDRLAVLVALVEAGQISAAAAKRVLAEIWTSGEEPAAAVARLGLEQVRDEAAIRAWIGEVLERHPGPAREFRAGKSRVLGFLVGRVMGRSGGRADPHLVERLLREALRRPEAEVASSAGRPGGRSA